MAQFETVTVEPHAALPDGAVARWKVAGPARTVARVDYESDDGEPGVWQVWACDARDQLLPARAVQVDDSSAGVSWLVCGGDHGLRLRHETSGVVVAEPWLLLDDGALVG